MWPFGRRAKPEPDQSLRDRVADLEKQVKVMRVEWEDWWDRYRRLYAKISKRAKEAESAAIEDREGTEGGPLDDRRGNGVLEWSPPPVASTAHLANRFRR